MFSQYESDVRTQANPNGIVGLSSAMHNEFERAVIFNDRLKPLQEFMSEMKGQYQTSFGLGSPFPKDFGERDRQRENRRVRVRASFNRDQFRYPRLDGGLHGRQEPFVSGQGAEALPIRGRAPWHAFREGTCRRGAACRFSHISN